MAKVTATPDRLVLLRRVVNARAQYWDLLRELERDICKGADSDNIGDEIDSLAAGINDPGEAFTRVTLDHLRAVIKACS